MDKIENENLSASPILKLISIQLSEALVKFSDSKLSSYDVQKIADIAVKNVDFTNSSLAHKGINWYVRDLLKQAKW